MIAAATRPAPRARAIVSTGIGVACYVFSVDGQAVLLARKPRPPWRGTLSAVAGPLEPGETPAAATLRIVNDQLSTEVASVRLAGVASVLDEAVDHQWFRFVFSAVGGSDETAGNPSRPAVRLVADPVPATAVPGGAVETAYEGDPSAHVGTEPEDAGSTACWVSVGALRQARLPRLDRLFIRQILREDCVFEAEARLNTAENWIHCRIRADRSSWDETLARLF